MIQLLLCWLKLFTDARDLFLARLKLRGQAEIIAGHFFLRGPKVLGKLRIVPNHFFLRLLEMPGEFGIVASQLCLAGFELLDTLCQVRKLARYRLPPLRQLGRGRSPCWTRTLWRC